MEENIEGLSRIIRILDEELTELQSVGLYREAERTRKRLEAYLDMRDTAREQRELPEIVRRYEGQ